MPRAPSCRNTPRYTSKTTIDPINYHHRPPTHPTPSSHPVKNNVISGHYAAPPISNFDVLVFGTAGFITGSTDVEHANNNLPRSLGFLGVKFLTPPPLEGTTKSIACAATCNICNAMPAGARVRVWRVAATSP